jgi:EAL domain-containing protein (putative c-di-GMP-specific phosphodiesterase class I)
MRLQRLQADSIKIDRSIVSLGRRSPILQSAVLLAQSMSKTLVAEGVTDPSLLPWLKETGCSQFQGKLFSMPVCVDLFVALL